MRKLSLLRPRRAISSASSHNLPTPFQACMFHDSWDLLPLCHCTGSSSPVITLCKCHAQHVTPSDTPLKHIPATHSVPRAPLRRSAGARSIDLRGHSLPQVLDEAHSLGPRASVCLHGKTNEIETRATETHVDGFLGGILVCGSSTVRHMLETLGLLGSTR
jgi:hypothetical protein